MCITVNARLDFIDGMAVSVVKESKDVYAIIVNGKIFRRGLRMKVSPREIEEALTSLYINKKSFDIFKYFTATAKTTVKEEIKNKKILEQKESPEELLNRTIDNKIGERLKEEIKLEHLDDGIKEEDAHINKVIFSDKDVYRDELHKLEIENEKPSPVQDRLISNFLNGQNLTMEELEKESERIRKQNEAKEESTKLNEEAVKMNEFFCCDKEEPNANEQIRSKLRKVNKAKEENPQVLEQMRDYNERVNSTKKEPEEIKEKLNNVNVDDCDYVTIKETLRDIKEQAVNFTERMLVFGLDTLSRILA